MPKTAIAHGPNGAHDALQLGGDGVQGPADAVVVQGGGVDAEDLGHCPGPGPTLHVHQGLGRGQPVRHQGLDHLAVGEDRNLPDGANPVDDAGDVESPAELRYHRQGAQRLVHAQWAVLDALCGHDAPLAGIP